jgi:hypothetical protein
MSHDRNNPDRQDGADDLAREPTSAFGDGRLPESVDDADDWLKDHPEASVDFADLERLKELYQGAGPLEPDEVAWTATLRRIAGAVPPPRERVRPSRRLTWMALGLMAAAALVAFLLVRSAWFTGPRTPPLPADEPYPVAEANDVNIISMDANDVAALVVGEPPVSDDLVFAQCSDIHVIKCKRCPISGRAPQLQRGEVPMFVVSVAHVENPDGE